MPHPPAARKRIHATRLRGDLQADGTDICFQGDVNATIDFGFDSVKYDGGGMEKNITHFALVEW